MSTAELRRIGSISVLDLDIIAKSYSADGVPFPFSFTQPSRFSRHDDYVDYARSVPDRLSNGDLRMFGECVSAYVHHDIRVECHTQHIPADTPSVRVLAYRLDETGFLAKQRPDDDVVDVYELSPYLLGSAVAGSAALQRPGRLPSIVIPEYARGANGLPASDEVTIHRAIDGEPSATTVPRAKVRAYSTAQSHWRPTRRWGLDREKNFAVWVRIDDDGEYLYTPDFTEAKPMTVSSLADRIDRLITEDVKALRRFRSG